uniref:Uncharacterized protein n=1 Tax=Trichogramma kaykai TaxID=54128 RepID=A0ABD2WRQ0_9HYME
MAIFSPKQGQLYARYRDCDAKGHCDGIQRNFGILMIDTREPTRSKDLVRTGTLNTYSMSALAVNEHNYRIYWSKTNDTDRQTELMSSTLDGSDIKKEFNIDFPYYMMISNNRLYMNTRFYGTELINSRGDVKSRRTKPRRASTCTHIVFSLALLLVLSRVYNARLVSRVHVYRGHDHTKLAGLFSSCSLAASHFDIACFLPQDSLGKKALDDNDDDCSCFAPDALDEPETETK